MAAASSSIRSLACVLVVALWAALAAAQQRRCPLPQLRPVNGIRPSVVPGYAWAVVATGLFQPRSLQFDAADNLWVLEWGKGVSKHAVRDFGGTCVGLGAAQLVHANTRLNHGLQLDLNRHRLLVSTSDTAYSVTLDNTNSQTLQTRTLVANMTNPGHTSRTLLLARGSADSLIISRGSLGNIDPLAANITAGHAVVKLFDISRLPNGQPYDFAAGGTLLGWGLRNDVGLTQHPRTGGLWAVENSIDSLQRDGRDVHLQNPGDELNFLGNLDLARLGLFRPKNYGYPTCVSAWRPELLPANSGLVVGSPFTQNSSNDGSCQDTERARLTFQAHSAPLDIKFNNSASQAWISFHGSQTSQASGSPQGYRIGYLNFGVDGAPTDPATSRSAFHSVMFNTNQTACPDHCFRPVGLAFDRRGRLWFASDRTGEIYVLQKL